MPRQPRIEFAGAFYHVMCRGNRGERIFEDDADRRMFLQTLTECCERSGWQIYAWVLMSNHYHWILHTPEPNLVAGMKWFQNTYTRRLNTRHKKWGHVFGGRYKAILVQSKSGNYLQTLMDYVHLNPARAGMVAPQENRQLIDFSWSSLTQGYALPPEQRHAWLAVAQGLQLFALEDTPSDRQHFLDRLEKRALEDAGRVTETTDNLNSTLQRGWYLGGPEFRKEMLQHIPDAITNRNYRTSAIGREKENQNATFWIERAREHFGIGELSMAAAPRPARLAAAWALHLRTNQPQAWIAAQLGLHSAANVSQQVRRIDSPNPPAFTTTKQWQNWIHLVRSF